MLNTVMNVMSTSCYGYNQRLLFKLQLHFQSNLEYPVTSKYVEVKVKVSAK